MISSFYVLRDSLNNFKKFAEGQTSRVERGEESEAKGSFKLPEIYGGTNAAAALAAAASKGAAAKQAPPAKAPPAKGGKPLEEEKSAAA